MRIEKYDYPKFFVVAKAYSDKFSTSNHSNNNVFCFQHQIVIDYIQLSL